MKKNLNIESYSVEELSEKETKETSGGCFFCVMLLTFCVLMLLD